MSSPRASDRFRPVEGRWLAGLGAVRGVVRQTLVAEQLDEALAGRSIVRVVDVGCGQGTQALRLARVGHEVVGVDLSPDLLDRFRADLAGEPQEVRDRVHLVVGSGEDAPALLGVRPADRAGPADRTGRPGVTDPSATPAGFDLVLCHGVLMYLDDDSAMLAALAALVRPGGLLSLLVRNAAGLAIRPGLLGDWTGVRDALAGAAYTNRLGLRARAHRVEDLDAALAPSGLVRRHWFGVRVLTDHLDGPPPTGPDLDAMLAAERAVAGVDPYRQVAALTHLVYARPAG